MTGLSCLPSLFPALRNAQRPVPSLRERGSLSPAPRPFLIFLWNHDLVMGRSFQSVRQGANSIAGRWERAAKKYPCGKRLVRIAKSYSSEGFIGCNDPLESVLFSAGVALQKEGDKPLPE